MKNLAIGLLLMGLTQAVSRSAIAADKVHSIQVVIHEECQRKISYESALAMIRPLYLTCVPGTKVSLDPSCEIACLKVNSGVVLGR